MRMQAQSNTGALDQKRLSLWTAGGLLAVTAVVLGMTVASENWIYLALALAAVISLWAPIEAALGAYALLLPFQSIAVLGHSTKGTTLNWAVGAIAAVALLGTGMARRRLTYLPRPALWWILFVFWALLTMAWAMDPRVALERAPTVVALIALYCVAVCWRISEKQFQFLSRLAILGGCLAAAYLIYQYFHGVTYTNWVGVTRRASLVLGGRETNPNGIGTDLVLPFALVIGEFLSAARRSWKLLALCAAGCMAYAVFLTMSRGSLLALTIVLAVCAYRMGLNRRLLLIGGSLLALLVTLPSTFFLRIKEAAATGGAGRLDIWRAGLHALERHFLFGAGLANFPVAYQEVAGYARSFVGYGRGAHNIYLETGVEFGILGCVLLIGAIVANFRLVGRLRSAAHKVPARMVALEAACWGMLVAGCFEAIVWDKSFWLTWMMLLMAIRLPEVAASATARSGVEIGSAVWPPYSPNWSAVPGISTNSVRSTLPGRPSFRQGL